MVQNLNLNYMSTTWEDRQYGGSITVWRAHRLVLYEKAGIWLGIPQTAHHIVLAGCKEGCDLGCDWLPAKGLQPICRDQSVALNSVIKRLSAAFGSRKIPPTKIPPTKIPPTKIPPTKIPPTKIPPSENSTHVKFHPTIDWRVVYT